MCKLKGILISNVKKKKKTPQKVRLKVDLTEMKCFPKEEENNPGDSCIAFDIRILDKRGRFAEMKGTNTLWCKFILMHRYDEIC